MNESGGTYMRAEPALVKELVWAGFDLVVARQQSHRRLRRARHAPDDEVRRRGGARAGRRRAEPGRSARGAIPRDAEGARRADLGGLDVSGSLARRPHPRRHAGAAGAESAPLHDDHHGDRRSGSATLRQIAGGDQRPRRGRRRRRRRRASERSTSSAAASRPAPTPGVRTEPRQGGRRRDRRRGQERRRRWPTTPSSRSTRTRAAAIASCPPISW